MCLWDRIDKKTFKCFEFFNDKLYTGITFYVILWVLSNSLLNIGFSWTELSFELNNRSKYCIGNISSYDTCIIVISITYQKSTMLLDVAFLLTLEMWNAILLKVRDRDGDEINLKGFFLMIFMFKKF